MIKEQFVSFETAKMLKEVGFNEPCCYNYDNINGFRWFKIGESTPKGWVPCPTQALAARWLREKHRIVVDVTFIPPSVNGDVWQYFIGEMDDMVWKGDFEPSDRRYKTYEEALEEGLKRSLELIKNKDYEEEN